MKHTKIIFYFCLIGIILFNFALAELTERTATSIREKNFEKTSELSPANLQTQNLVGSPELSRLPEKSPANFILVTDVLDGFGGQRYNGGCALSYFAGGQSSPVGAGSSPNYKLYSGFIYPTVVLCGDVNGSGVVELGDVVYLISYLYKNGPAPIPLQAGDVNCSGSVELGDVVYLISYLYKSGPAPIC